MVAGAGGGFIIKQGCDYEVADGAVGRERTGAPSCADMDGERNSGGMGIEERASYPHLAGLS